MGKTDNDKIIISIIYMPLTEAEGRAILDKMVLNYINSKKEIVMITTNKSTEDVPKNKKKYGK